MLLKGVFIPKWLNKPSASCLLVNLNILLLDTAYFDKNFIFLVSVFVTWGFLLSTFSTPQVIQ